MKEHCGLRMSVMGTAGKDCGDIVQCMRCGYRCYGEPERVERFHETGWKEQDEQSKRAGKEGGGR